MDPSPSAPSLFNMLPSGASPMFWETATTAGPLAFNGSVALPLSSLPLPLAFLRQDILPLTHFSLPSSSFDTLPTIQKLMRLEETKLHESANVSLPAALRDVATLQMNKGELNHSPLTVPSFPPASPSLFASGVMNSLSTAAQLQALQSRETELMVQMQCVKQQKQMLGMKRTVKIGERSTSSNSSMYELPSMKKHGERSGCQGLPSKRRKGERKATVVRQDQFHAAVAAQLLDDMAKDQAGKQSMKRKTPELMSSYRPREGKTCANPGRLDAAAQNAFTLAIPKSPSGHHQTSQGGPSSSPASAVVSSWQTMTSSATANGLSSVGEFSLPEDSRSSFAEANADPLSVPCSSSEPGSHGGPAVDSSVMPTVSDGNEQALVRKDYNCLDMEWSVRAFLEERNHDITAVDLQLKL